MSSDEVPTGQETKAAHMETDRRRGPVRPLVSDLPEPVPATPERPDAPEDGDDTYSYSSVSSYVSRPQFPTKTSSLYPKDACGGHLCAADPRFSSPYLPMVDYEKVKRQVVTFRAPKEKPEPGRTAGVPAPAAPPVPVPLPVPTKAPEPAPVLSEEPKKAGKMKPLAELLEEARKYDIEREKREAEEKIRKREEERLRKMMN